jgi:SET domain-containing protein
MNHECIDKKTVEYKIYEFCNLAFKIKTLQGIKIKDIIIESLITMTTLPYPFESNIEIRKSNIHGNGVFATENIKKDSIITFYPAHLIKDNEFQNEQGAYRTFFTNNKVFEPNDDYKLNITQKYSIYGDKNKISNKRLLGHMINDSNRFNVTSNDIIEIKNEVSSYLLKSQTLNNCKLYHIDKYEIPYIKAIKDIKKGDELLMAYDPIYWLSVEQKDIFINQILNDKNFIKFMHYINYR